MVLCRFYIFVRRPSGVFRQETNPFGYSKSLDLGSKLQPPPQIMKLVAYRHLEMRIGLVLPEQKLRFTFASGARVYLHHFNLPFRKTPFPRWLGVHFPTLEIDSSHTETRTIEALLTEEVKQKGLASVLGQSKVSTGTGGPVETSGSPQGSKISTRPRFSVRPEEWGFRPTTGTGVPLPAARPDVVQDDDDVILPEPRGIRERTAVR